MSQQKRVRIRESTVCCDSLCKSIPRQTDGELRNDFGNKYVHFAWVANLGLTESSAIPAPAHTLIDRRIGAGKG